MVESVHSMARPCRRSPSVFRDGAAQFRAAIEELAVTLVARDERQNRRKSSREALAELVRRGVAAIDVLDAIVKPRLESQPDLLATWGSVKRQIETGGGAIAGSVEPDIMPVKVA